MDMHYETDRLLLKILQEDSAPAVLDFYQKNKDVFETWEPKHPKNFYTKDYIATLMRCEFDLAMKMLSVRFWVFLKENPRQIIGTVSFQDIIRSIYQSCHIGYKFDPDYWHQGYAKESITKAISVVLQEFQLHRIEALVLPENLPSIRLLENLNFQYEGVSRSSIYLTQGWTDHLRYSFIHPNHLQI